MNGTVDFSEQYLNLNLGIFIINSKWMIKQKEWRKITDSRFRFGFFVKRTTSTRFVDPTQQTESRPTRRREPGQREMKRQKQGSKDSYNWNSNCFQFTLIALETRLEILYSSLSHFSLGLNMHIALTVDDKDRFCQLLFLVTNNRTFHPLESSGKFFL